MASKGNNTGRREHRRVRIALQVSYRSTGSFLVSYSVDISQGGLFIETTRPREVGTEIELWLAIPGTKQDVRLKGTVVWIRRQAQAGHPPGMGVQFQQVEADCGQLIDQIVRHFSGLRGLVASASSRTRGQLSRMVRAAMAIHIDEHRLDAPHAGDGLDLYDLVIVDLGDGDEVAIQLLEDILRAGKATAVVALSGHSSVRQRALQSGAHAVISSPPAQSELRAAVLRALGRPLAQPANELEDE
jgi:uncharacterized protein (TIGR02266 family)